MAYPNAPWSLPGPARFQLAGLGFRSSNAQDQFDSFGALLLALTPVPEPALGSLAGGVLALAFAAPRRRTRG